MLKGKNAIITGASRGIGRATALLFAEHGAFVGINYLMSKDKAEEVLSEIKKSGGKGILIQGDVSNERDVEQMIKRFIKERKSIDILVLNAGIYMRSDFLNISKKSWDRTLNVNLTGCYNVCKQAIPFIREGGSIIFISSQLAFKGSEHGADYAASKAGMLGLMRSLALELAPRGIRVNAIAPGTIDTDIISSYTEEKRRERESEIPMRRLGKPEEVAKVCLFLASDLSSYITGETIHVNGGLYIH
ncbi:MAG TPA: 3-oxoacyl-ACP reductase FabG [Thermoplasmatales archaeon]|nr:3-oxoacyl-ACP reductase FabG [Thermoplasmatales archaeon]